MRFALKRGAVRDTPLRIFDMNELSPIAAAEQADINTASAYSWPALDPDKINLVGMDRADLGEAMRQLGVAEKQIRMRVTQLWHWIYVRGATSFDQMTNVSKDLRAKMDLVYTITHPELVAEQISMDGTRKWLLRFPAARRRPPGGSGNGLYPG